MEKEHVPVLIAATFLNGLNISMNTIPMLKTWTTPPAMYSMKACIGKYLAGEIARSHALFCFRASYESAYFDVSTASRVCSPIGIVSIAVYVVL